MDKEIWPELSYDKGKETYQTIHLWAQIAGKIKLAKQPWINHSWHVTLFLTPFGLTTGIIPARQKHFQIDLDFLNHRLQITTSRKEEKVFDLQSLSVAACYRNVISALQSLEIDIEINPVPNEMENAIPFHEDEGHATYIPDVATDLYMALLNAHRVFTEFRSKFAGKCSPVHFFWGSFDLAVSRFSGREAPLHPGGIPNLPNWVVREAYSHEVSSCGFWPGNEAIPFAAFYSYIYPEPRGFKSASVKPDAAYYHHDLGEFILPYQEVQQAAHPSQMLLDFLESTYQAAAGLANWDIQNLERQTKGKYSRSHWIEG